MPNTSAGMLNNPDRVSFTSLNRWIVFILTFHFKLWHVPSKTYGLDSLSQRPPQPNNINKEEEDDKEVFLMIGSTTSKASPTSSIWQFQPLFQPICLIPSPCISTSCRWLQTSAQMSITTSHTLHHALMQQPMPISISVRPISGLCPWSVQKISPMMSMHSLFAMPLMLRPRAYRAVAGVGVRSEHSLRDGFQFGLTLSQLWTSSWSRSVPGVDNLDTPCFSDVSWSYDITEVFR